MFILLGFLKTIEVNTKEDFIRALQEQECVTLRVEVKREVFGCPNFKETGCCEEIFSYTTEFSAKNKKGRRVVFLKRWERDTEKAGDTVYDLAHFLQVIKEQKEIVNEIRELIHSIDIWIVVPKRKPFNNGGYEEIVAAINE